MGEYSILVVDDEESICRLIAKELQSGHRSVRTAFSGTEARRQMRARPPDVVLLDLCLPDADGLELLAELRRQQPDTEFVLLTGYGTIALAVEAMRIGAYDFLTKPFKLDRLEQILEQACHKVRQRQASRPVRREGDPGACAELIGNAPGMKNLRALIRKVAPTEVPVLFTGETGTGKDVSAMALHEASKRSSRPMVVKNCAALQKDLARSELFGHCRGAFTGATESREGLIAAAEGGTLFLDEVGELSLDIQGSLLRVLETSTYRRIGAKQETRADVRFAFATNRDLAREVEQGRFLEALYHRINVFRIQVPSLRERLEDVPLLVEHFLHKLRPESGAVLSARAASLLNRYSWPGNVRELRNVIERSLILAENGIITEDDLPEEIAG
jgi:two-component system NtrC family response regulator